jgi:DNA-binding transcriptional ArsR family regulator
MIMTFKLGQHTYVGITPRGLTHPQYDSAAPKCEAADLLSDFGEARVKFVQYLEILGPARTVDLTYAMPKGYFDGRAVGSGQIIQGLEHAGIVRKTEAEEGRHPLYALTAGGRFVSGIFARVNPLPPVDRLRQVISERHREKAERLRSLGLKNVSNNPGVASPTQAAIVRALGEGKPLTTTEITLTMDTKFKNPRSIHLALRRLNERGIIRLAGIGSKKENIWNLSEQNSGAE